MLAFRGLSVLLAVLAAGFLTLGVQLALLGGSVYYLAAGLGLAASAVLFWKDYRRGTTVFAVVFLITLAWSLWEAGLDGWALAPRLGLFVALQAVVIALYLSAGHKDGPSRWRDPAIGAPTLGFALLFVAVLGAELHTPTAKEAASPHAATQADVSGDWPHFGNVQGGARFSPLEQITPHNVDKLKVAWVHRLGPDPEGLMGALQVTPLKVDDSVFVCTPFNDVVSLDAESGTERWRYRHPLDREKVERGICRGVAYYKTPDSAGACAERILTSTMDAQLIALDARTGERCAGFGENGAVNLLKHMGPVIPGYYFAASPPQIVRGKVVIGGRIADNQFVGEPPGVIRAYDAVTGEFAWAFDIGDPDNHDEPAPGENYTLGTPNSWAPMSADKELGLVYVPTGNATPDYVSSHRSELDNAYASSVIALDAETGGVRWSFQTAHLDVWDYDVASQPTLVDIPQANGKPKKALAQGTKRGELFLLDRANGEPLAEVVERPAPPGDVPGEPVSPTQPFSVGMPSFAGPVLRERDMWGVTPFDQAVCRIMFRRARYEGPVTPVGVDRPTIVYPGYFGGMNWGSVSIDADRSILVVGSHRMAMYDRLLSREESDELGLAPHSPEHPAKLGGASAQAGTPYGADIRLFMSPWGIPCQEPPYAMLSAVDLQTRQLLWTKRFGVARKNGPFGIQSGLPFTMGAPHSGAAIATRSGITFIAASSDQYIRAIDTLTGRELWKDTLPAGGQAAPITYLSPESGRQFVVVAAGGSPGLRTKPGDYIVAYALVE